MTKLLILSFSVFLLSCSNSKNTSNSFDWLLGNWKRTNEVVGKETFENWQKISKNEYLGIGFTLQNGDTVNQEKMRLIQTNGNWDLIVKMPDDLEETHFKGTNHTESEFTCENNEIDFPNIIRYWKNGEKINALVSNSELEISFEFEKIE